MADDRWNESRNLWGRDRRLERERTRRDGRDRIDFGPGDYEDWRAFGGRDYGDQAGGPDRRSYRDEGPIYAAETRPPRSEGRYYGADRRYDSLSPDYRDFEAAQRRIHHGDYDPDRYTPNPREGRGDESRSWWDRTQDRVSSWFGDDEARRRAEWDERRAEAEGEHRGRGPKGYRRSDMRILDDVNDRLADDAYLDATEIEVTVKDAEVTLNGLVFRREDKRRAEDLAERVSGVTHVQNNLRLSPQAGEAKPLGGEAKA